MKYSLPPPIKTENRCNNKDYIRAILFIPVSFQVVFQYGKNRTCVFEYEIDYLAEDGTRRSEFCMT